MADIQRKLNTIDSQGKTMFHVRGRVTMSTAGGVEAVTVTGARVGDVVMLSLEVDDTGTTYVLMTGVISAANTLTITVTDDSSSADVGQISYEVIRL